VLKKPSAADQPPQLHRGPIYAVAFSPDGKNLATAAADGIVRGFQLTSGTDTAPSRQWSYDDAEAKLTRIDIDDPYASAAYGVAFTQAGGSAITLASAQGYLGSWNLAQSTPKPTQLWPKLDSAATSPLYCLAANCAGTKLAVGCQDGTLAVLDVATKNVLFSQKHTAAIVSLAFHPKLDNVVAIVDWRPDATPNEQQSLVVWDLSVSTPVFTEPDCCAAAWQKSSPLRIVVAGQGGNIRLFDVSP
jgi:WD40 repeat protein